MSPTVPPISVITTSASVASATRRMRALISFVMCGITCTVEPRYSPLRSLRSTRVPDRAGGVVRVAREVLVDEALVVADVEVGLGAVLGDEHLAVLERAHRARVDVEVRVELLHLHLQAARLQQAAERRGGDALAERRDDAAGDEDVLRRAAHACRPEAVERAQSTGVRSISAPSERRSPRRLRPGERPDRQPAASSRESTPRNSSLAWRPARSTPRPRASPSRGDRRERGGRRGGAARRRAAAPAR